MDNILIYTGLGILLLGACFGIYVSLKGLRNRKSKHSATPLAIPLFQSEPDDPEMKKLKKIWSAVIVIGFIFTGIGIAIALKTGC